MEPKEQKIVSEDTIDILMMYEDAMEIIYGTDNDDIHIYSEVGIHTPPNFMRSAAQRGLTIRSKEPVSNKCETPIGLDGTKRIAEGGQLSLNAIKRTKSYAQRHGKNLKAHTKPNSKIAQDLLMRGIPASPNGVQRVVKWCDDKIRDAERRGGNQ